MPQWLAPKFMEGTLGANGLLKNKGDKQLGRPERWEHRREELGGQTGRTVNENSGKEAMSKERD